MLAPSSAIGGRPAASIAAALLFALAPHALAQEPTGAPAPFTPGPVILEGTIEDYRRVYETGQLSCFDGVTRLPDEQVFAIDEDGRFQVQLDLLHPVFGTARLDLEGVFHALYLEPGTTYRVVVRGGELEFVGETGRANEQLRAYSRAAAEALANERSEFEAIQARDLPAEDAWAAMAGFAQRRREHLARYSQQHPLSADVARILELDIRYEEAHAAICYRYTTSSGRPAPRPTLAKDYVDAVLRRHPLNADGAVVSRRFIDYVANLAQALEEPLDASLEARIAYYASQGTFTERELELLAGALAGDPSTFQADDFPAFDTSENKRREFTLRKRYAFETLLDRVAALPRGLGRDLVVSQGLARGHLAGDLIVPTAAEWARIEGLVESTAVLAAMRRAASERAAESRATLDAEQAAASTGALAEILHEHLGRTVYIDFWATWCAPCRLEIPHAKRLAAAFRGEPVLFLNVCARSAKDDWERMVEQQDLEGLNLFLDDHDYALAAKRFGVTGFPTYVLIDPQGRVVRDSAPRPSSGQEIIELIRSAIE